MMSLLSLIGDICLSVTVLLLAIMNHINIKRIDKLEEALNDLVRFSRIVEYERRKP